MHNISFAMTTEAIRRQTKTVTRRTGWRTLEPGTLLQPVVKGMGLKKGEHPEKIGGPIRVVSVIREPLNTIDAADCAREGFPGMRPDEFVRMLCYKYKCQPDTLFTRIEFEYVEPARREAAEER